MKRSLVLSTSIALAATTIFGAAAAGADPALDIRADGTSIYDGGVAAGGSRVTFDISGCMTGGGEAGYVGLFASAEGDPLTSASDHGESEAFPDGSYHTDWGVTPMDEGAGSGWSTYLRWYCSASPVTSLSDPTLYSSELITVTVGSTGGPIDPGGRPAVAVNSGSFTSRIAVRPGSGATATVSTWGTRVETDPNALPLVDHLGIEGNRAAILKRKVDAASGVNKRKQVTNTDYAKAAYKVLSGRSPSNKQLAKAVASLDHGSSRVRVVEDIALTVNPSAKQWNSMPLFLLQLLY